MLQNGFAMRVTIGGLMILDKVLLTGDTPLTRAARGLMNHKRAALYLDAPGYENSLMPSRQKRSCNLTAESKSRAAN